MSSFTCMFIFSLFLELSLWNLYVLLSTWFICCYSILCWEDRRKRWSQCERIKRQGIKQPAMHFQFFMHQSWFFGGWGAHFIRNRVPGSNDQNELFVQNSQAIQGPSCKRDSRTISPFDFCSLQLAAAAGCAHPKAIVCFNPTNLLVVEFRVSPANYLFLSLMSKKLFFW